MSQSPNTRFSEDHSADLSAVDLFLALLLHALILTIIALLIWWKGIYHEEPLQRIEVMMISAKQLSDIEQQARRKARPVKTEAKPKPEPAPKQKPKPKPVVQSKPAPQPKPASKPVAKPKPAPKAARKPAELDFDPFAPIASTTDRSESTAKASTSRPELANLQGKQLSQNEIERYIALMQAAVNEHWKVAANAGDVRDPVVEMELSPDGKVVNIKLLESSGSDSLDASLVRAIHAAAPFQVPPVQQFEYFRVNTIRFHPLK